MRGSVRLFAILPFLIPIASAGSDEESFLEAARVLDVRPSENEVTLVDPDGKSFRIREGEALDEAGGATLKRVRRSTLVWTRPVTGGDGQTGEALIVVRFGPSGKTEVREFWSVPDAPRPRAPGRRR